MKSELVQQTLKNLFTVNLGVQKNERILVFTDYPNSQRDLDPESERKRQEIQKVAHEVAFVGHDYGEMTFYRFLETGRHGVEPPQELWEKAFGQPVIEKLVAHELMQKILAKTLTEEEKVKVRNIVSQHAEEAVDVVIGLSWNSTTHTRFRKLLTEVCGCRYASMPEFEKPMLTRAMAVDYQEMAARTQRIADCLQKADAVRICAPNGTDLTIVISGRPAFCDTGVISEKGRFSNLPAGEVFLAPLEGKSEGKLVLNIAASKKLGSEITLEFKDGMVERIEGADPYRDYLEDLFSKNSLCRNMAELGIGTNVEAKDPLNILEAEKIWGTIHIALGDNSGFGGNIAAPFHQDYVVFTPTMTLIGAAHSEKTVLKNGKWLDLD